MRQQSVYSATLETVMNADDERAGAPSASAYYRDTNCLANRRMGQMALIMGKVPPETEDAQRGRIIHKAIETGDLTLVPSEFLETAKAFRQKFLELTEHFAGEIAVEKRFWLEHYYSAKPDLILSGPERIDYYDWKPTIAPDWDSWESQIIADAVVLSPKDKKLIGHIISNHGTRDYEFSPSDLAYFSAKLHHLLLKLEDGSGPPTPGPWCKYCEGRLICPAVVGLITKTPDLAMDALPRGEKGAQIIARLKAGIRAAYEILDWYTQAIEADPGFVDGLYGVTPGRVTYQITDKLKAFQTLSKYFSPEALAQASDISVAQLKELYRSSAGGTKKDAQGAVHAMLNGLIEPKQARSSLRKQSTHSGK